MKFEIFKDKSGEWRWNAQAGGNILFCSGEGFEKPQKVVASIRKNIVRGDVKLEAALVKALKLTGLNEKGGLIKVETPKPVDKLSKKAEWPYPEVTKSK